MRHARFIKLFICNLKSLEVIYSGPFFFCNLKVVFFFFFFFFFLFEKFASFCLFWDEQEVVSERAV